MVGRSQLHPFTVVALYGQDRVGKSTVAEGLEAVSEGAVRAVTVDTETLQESVLGTPTPYPKWLVLDEYVVNGDCVQRLVDEGMLAPGEGAIVHITAPLEAIVARGGSELARPHFLERAREIDAACRAHGLRHFSVANEDLTDAIVALGRRLGL